MQYINSSMQHTLDEVYETEHNLRETYNSAAGLLAGRLRTRGVDEDLLCDLKRELRDFDAKQCKWKQ